MESFFLGQGEERDVISMAGPKTAPILKAEPKGVQRGLVILLLSAFVHSETYPEVSFFFCKRSPVTNIHK